MDEDIEIAYRFAFHAATTEEKRAEHGSVRQLLGDVAQELGAKLPEGRERAIVLTKLEEAMFWANAAIARTAPVGV